MSVAKLFFGLIDFFIKLFIKLGILLIILLVVALFVANNTIPPYSKHQEKAAEFLEKNARQNSSDDWQYLGNSLINGLNQSFQTYKCDTIEIGQFKLVNYCEFRYLDGSKMWTYGVFGSVFCFSDKN